MTRPEALPSGTVTFAFTDVEGSTQRWERDGAAMEAALSRQSELMRGAIAAHAGRVFKTIDGAFCAAFSRPEDAVAAMLEAQRALAREDFSAVEGLRVRAAIHTGTADERDGDYFGPAVNRVARLLAIGHGGQVLVSGITTALARDALTVSATFGDLGEHRLRDLTRAEHVFQLQAQGLAADFPPLRSLGTLANNLPHQLTTFVGRETEVAEITELLARHRLVTLTGSGGVGKTRASLQVAANLLDGSGDGVWLTELAPLASGDYIPTTVAHALHLTLPAQGDPIASLTHALAEKHALLVFDNCEHLIDAAAKVIGAILHVCPRIKILASSRQPLRISGEATYRMPSLGLPSGDTSTLSAAGSTNFAAIALFVERAKAVDARFALTDENAPIVADICRRLDGIPLAIELAAARVKVFSSRQLRERLDERFRVLTGGTRDVLPQHQTLRALIDWSYQLLDERERVLFRRLGIFVNGFTLEGAGAVAADDGFDEADVFDVLASLVDKSLVLTELEGDEARYRLLESTRAFALEKLDEAGERTLLTTRHMRYLRNRFAGIWAIKQASDRRTELVEAFASELEDLRFALDGALASGAVIEGAELLTSLEAHWAQIGLTAEGARRCQAYIAALPRDQARLLALLSVYSARLVAERGGRMRTLQIAAEAVAFARASGDAEVLATALSVNALMTTFAGRFDEADAALREGEAISGISAAVRCGLLDSRAALSLISGDVPAAVRAYEQLRVRARSIGDIHAEHSAAMNLAEAEHALGHTERAIAVSRETIPAIRATQDSDAICNVLRNLAGYLVATDDLDGALEAAHEAIGTFARHEPDNYAVAIAIEHLALVHALRGDLTRAAKEAGYCDAALRRHEFNREFNELTTYNRLTAVLRDGLGAEELERLTVEGVALSPEAAIALAIEEG